MYIHQPVVFILLVVLAIFCAWAATRLLRGAPGTGRAMAGAACILLALMFGAWAVNYAAA
jgi:hypothetical protein